jgi:hypothetical protein
MAAFSEYTLAFRDSALEEEFRRTGVPSSKLHKLNAVFALLHVLRTAAQGKLLCASGLLALLYAAATTLQASTLGLACTHREAVRAGWQLCYAGLGVLGVPLWVAEPVAGSGLAAFVKHVVVASGSLLALWHLPTAHLSFRTYLLILPLTKALKMAAIMPVLCSRLTASPEGQLLVQRAAGQLEAATSAIVGLLLPAAAQQPQPHHAPRASVEQQCRCTVAYTQLLLGLLLPLALAHRSERQRRVRFLEQRAAAGRQRQGGSGGAAPAAAGAGAGEGAALPAGELQAPPALKLLMLGCAACLAMAALWLLVCLAVDAAAGSGAWRLGAAT